MNKILKKMIMMLLTDIKRLTYDTKEMIVMIQIIIIIKVFYSKKHMLTVNGAMEILEERV
jgi:hypothetical protein